MKPFEYYSNRDLYYPSKADFKEQKLFVKTPVASGMNNILEYLNLSDVDDISKYLKINSQYIIETFYNEEAYKESLKQYRTISNARDAEFRRELFEEAGVTDNPKADILFSKAWEQGHSSGYSEVYNIFYDLLELIQ